jgi:hypothetical protein
MSMLSTASTAIKDLFGYLGAVMSLPPIRGKWYFVDPYSGTLNSGATFWHPTNSLRVAYGKCITSAGDGICFLSRASATSSDTTAYLGGGLTWAKHGITFYGVCAGQGFNNRARVVSLDRAYTASTLSWTAAGVMTDTAEGFLDEGFEVGDAILCTATSGTAITSLNVVSAVTAGTLTLTMR